MSWWEFFWYDSRDNWDQWLLLALVVILDLAVLVLLGWAISNMVQ
jgi:hypothetical protein